MFQRPGPRVRIDLEMKQMVKSGIQILSDIIRKDVTLNTCRLDLFNIDVSTLG